MAKTAAMATAAANSTPGRELTRYQFMVPTDQDSLSWESQDLIRKAEKVTIKNPKGRDQVGALLIATKTMLTQAEEDKKAILKPIKDQLVLPVEGYFKKIINGLTKAEGMFKNALANWDVAKTQEYKELVGVLREAAAQEGAMLNVVQDQDIGNMEVAANHAHAGGNINFTPTWNFEVLDMDQIPVEILREAACTTRGKEAVEQVIRSRVALGTRTLPGTRIWEGRKVSVVLDK